MHAKGLLSFSKIYFYTALNNKKKEVFNLFLNKVLLDM